MRVNIVTKTLFYVSVVTVLLLVYQSIIYMKYNVRDEHNKYLLKNISDVDKGLKYILQWTSPNTVPFVYMGAGRNGFMERNCSFTNCFVTANRSHLDDYTKFDVIAFAAPEIRFLSDYNIDNYLPMRRSPHQKFVFATIESADNYPLCSYRFNNFFNWTWTYRLESEAKWGYMAIRDSEKKIIGPKKNMHWMKLKDMDPVSDDVKSILKNKTKAAAWFISNCYSRNKREVFARDLERWLVKYNLKIDIYGDCGSLSCSRDNEKACDKMIERDYYFYLSFENSFAEDYVTEKLLHPLQNYAVPIVYGGANYSRFMPDGIYLNALELGPEKVAEKMYELIQNPGLYEEYFKWTNHYSYHKRFESEETDDYCRFCSMLNDEELVKKVSVYENFEQWWNPPGRCM